ncbi:hypothetical protein PU560_12865 [Georgenia sp. 10Sc9-8]|uniref:Uncharacterized protein n=1 Tax=Georgenia halotolerans TaxID=3028317 RepID=A0ABT5TZ52_9MICO|nr:hypothetical protein [Georgenia halotolerans]
MELPAHLDHHLRRRAGDGADGQGGEQEAHRPADEKPHKDVGLIDPDADEVRAGDALVIALALWRIRADGAGLEAGSLPMRRPGRAGRTPRCRPTGSVR